MTAICVVHHTQLAGAWLCLVSRLADTPRLSHKMLEPPGASAWRRAQPHDCEPSGDRQAHISTVLELSSSNTLYRTNNIVMTRSVVHLVRVVLHRQRGFRNYASGAICRVSATVSKVNMQHILKKLIKIMLRATSYEQIIKPFHV
jgi:hypothetical protein